MAMHGVIKNRNGKMYVLYTYDEYTEPFRQFLWYLVLERRRNPYTMAYPEDGDTVESRGGNSDTHEWSAGSHGSVTTTKKADSVERVSINPPSSRGKEIRWHDGRWEKLMASGWQPVGDGGGKTARKKAKAV